MAVTCHVSQSKYVTKADALFFKLFDNNSKGVTALESRTEGRLVSQTTAAKKKNCYPIS